MKHVLVVGQLESEVNVDFEMTGATSASPSLTSVTRCAIPTQAGHQGLQQTIHGACIFRLSLQTWQGGAIPTVRVPNSRSGEAMKQ